ncbi:MAG TPA: oligosaccharide flippase family protein [Gaiellaceae bacterium]|jgi:O-antigen/teichoic acid export membrane protein|nr:oligosaccharide flippase family protein [Gaiellaceae bacterium]
MGVRFRVARGPLATSFGASLLIQGLNVLTGIVLARTLGPEGRGELAAILLWPAALATVGNLGVADATTFYAARRRAALGTLAGSAAVVWLAQSLLLVSVAAAVVSIVFSGYPADVRPLALAYVAYIPLFLATVYAMNLLQGLHQFRDFQFIRLLLIALTAAGLTAAWASASLGVGAAVLVYLGASSVTAVAAVILLGIAGATPLRVDRRVVSDLLRYGVRSHPSTVATMLNERADQLVISLFLAPAKLGLYVVAVTLTSLTSLVGSSIALVAMPRLAREVDRETRQRMAARYVRLTLVGSLLLTVPLLLITPRLLEILFGTAFNAAAGVARILLVAAVLLTTGRLLAAVLKAVDRPLRAGLADALALVVTVAGLALLLPAFGLVGAGLASLAAYAAATGWMAREAARALDVPVRGLVFAHACRSGIAVSAPSTAGGSGS